MKVLLVDDEAPARQLLREYLADYPQLRVVGEAANGVEAVRLIGAEAPDLVFLDVQMPGLTGLEVVQQLASLPQVIFATAYDAYALEAFERNAVDYLLKPFTRQRFAMAVQRVLAGRQDNLDRLRQLTEGLLEAREPTRRYPAKLLVPAGRRIAALDPADVVRVEAEGDYARLHTADGSYLAGQGLSALAERLDPADFYRVHRSSIVNLRHVAELRREGSTYYVVTSTGEQVRVSRGYADVVRGWLV